MKTTVEELAGNNVSVQVDVSEGDRAQIRQINVVGNKVFSDEDILEQDKLIEKEIEEGVIMDPAEAAMAVDGFNGMAPGVGEQAAGGSGGDLGAPIMEPNLEGSKDAGMTKLPKGGEI